MTPAVVDAHHALGVLDVVCGFFLVWATQRTTAEASVFNTRGRWAWYRRIVYSAMAVAVFGLGVKRFFDDTDDMLYVVFQTTLLFGICSFIFLRAIGYITQDVFTNGNGRGNQGGSR